jgi:surface protein
MKDICQKLATKIERNVNSLVFLYGGSNLNFQLSFKDQANIIDKERNEMKVLVYKNESDELSCPKCGEKINLNTEKINDIKSSIKNIDDTIRGAKLMIESIIKICTMDVVNVQLKNVNLIFNTLNEDIKKLTKKFDDLLNVKEINFDNYIIAEIDIKDEDVNKNIKILGSYEEFFRANPGKLLEDNIFKNEDEIKKCEIKINNEIIPFNYYHQFKSKGKYTIKYSFKNNLKCTCLMFGDCKLLTNINLSNFNTNNVTDMGHMFYGCSSLNKIDLSNFNTNNVTNMDCMFGDCPYLNNNNIIVKDKRIFNIKTLFEEEEEDEED